MTLRVRTLFVPRRPLAMTVASVVALACVALRSPTAALGQTRPATPISGVNPAAPAVPAAGATVASADADARAIGRRVDALGMIWKDVEAQPLGSKERAAYLEEFMTKSELIRELPADNSARGGLWTLRALAAYELNRSRDAWEAGEVMLASGLDASDNELVRKTLALLERRGLLDPKTGDAATFVRQRAELAEARRLANPYDYRKARSILEGITRESPDFAPASTLLSQLNANAPKWEREAFAALFNGAAHDDVAQIRQAIARGQDITALATMNDGTPNEVPRPALTIACERGSAKAVQALIEAGAPVNSASPDYPAPLEAAAAHGRPALITYLLQHGADKNRMRGGANALRAAIVARQSACAQLLLDDRSLAVAP